MKRARFSIFGAIGGIVLCTTPVEAQRILPGIIHQWSADGDATDSVGTANTPSCCESRSIRRELYAATNLATEVEERTNSGVSLVYA